MNDDTTRLPVAPIIGRLGTQNPDLSETSPSRLPGDEVDRFSKYIDTEVICADSTLEGSNECPNHQNCRIDRVASQLADLIGRQIAREEFQRMARASMEES